MNPVLRDVTNVLPKKREIGPNAAKESNAKALRKEDSAASKKICLELGLGQNRFHGLSVDDDLKIRGRDGCSPSYPAIDLSKNDDRLDSVDGVDDEISVSDSPPINDEANRPCPKALTTSGCKSYGLNRCSGSNLNGNIEFEKSCSCPFCIKAAFILCELHFQDMKGRLASLKKSQKEAANLVSKYAKEKHEKILNQSDPSASNIELDLAKQWTVLFQHMEDLLSRETLHLQSNFMELTKIRDDCKAQLERITGPQ